MEKSKKVVNKILAFCMVMVVCVACSVSGVTVQAETRSQDLFKEEGATLKSAGDTYIFTTYETKNFYVEVNVTDPANSVNVTILSLRDGSSATDTIDDKYWRQDGNIYWDTLVYKSLPAGTYQVTISSDNTGNYNVYGWVEEPLTINATSISLYAGQTKTLKISGTKVPVPIKWSSSKKSVATVNSAGKVTAKKAGKATITAKVGEESLKCSVTVKKPIISSKKFTITAGQKKTLKVTKNSGKVKWKTNKKSVATVSKKGVVTAKKAGKAKITASVDGCKLTCTVTVKKNEYTAPSYGNADAGYGVGCYVTKVSYNKKGELVAKIRIINNSPSNVEELRKIKFSMVTENGSTIVGSYSIGTKRVFVYSGSNKTFTITIPKSKVKKKNADLRNGVPHIDGEIWGR